MADPVPPSAADKPIGQSAIVGLILFEILLTLLQWWLSGHVG
jgi:hypothetical protein